MLVAWCDRGKSSVLGVISNAVAGLGAITPASGFAVARHQHRVVAGTFCY
jgi:Amt family ammonium transporter